MYKMSKQTPKIPKIDTTPLLFYVDTRKKIEIEKRQCISFHPRKWNVPYRNHRACCEKLWFVRSISPNLPQMGQKNYHGMFMPLHDSMPSFMNFRRGLDLLEFKNQVYISMFAAEWRWQGVWHSFSFLSWDLIKRATKDTYLNFSTNLYALEHVVAIQIWIMHMNA